MRKFLIFFMTGLTSLSLLAQERNFWTPVDEAAVGKNLFVERTRPLNYKIFSLNETLLGKELVNAPSEKKVAARNSSFIIIIPNPDGQPEKFRVVEAPVMDPRLAAKYPGIHSYAGRGIDHPTSTIRFDLSVHGFSAMIRSADRPTFYISPLDRSGSIHIVVSRTDMDSERRQFECLTRDLGIKDLPQVSVEKNADDGILRTYRLALAASGEFSQFYLTGLEANDAERRANVLAKLNSLMTRCNGIFEEDFDARLVIVGNNDLIIYLDPGTDPWPGSGYNSQTQTTIDAVIMNANYDIGHLVDRNGNNGNAGCIGCVCNAGSKGSGFTSLSGSNWNSDLFVIDFFPHEMGHQMGGNHTFSHASEGPTIAQVETGSGVTIMGYAGITGVLTDVQAHSIDNFHAISIQQITDHLKTRTCDVEIATGNAIPTANAGGDFTIPHSTPFQLTGSGTDANGEDVLSFVWEQNDVANAFGVRPTTTQTAGPVFRCYSPTPGTSRTFPAYENILDGSNTNTWEKLPSVGRTLNFRFTVRDNNPGQGANNSDDMVVTVSGSTGPFGVTSPNSAVVWCPGPHTVTWSVNGSNAQAANVKISLSTDGGINFPVVLAASTANDGSQSVTIPCTFSTQARIKVEAVGNIFFDISNANFTVGDNTDPTFTSPSNVTLFKDADCNYNAGTEFTGDVTDEADNCDASLNATFVDAVAAGSCVGETIITRTWTLTDDCGNSTVKVQTITITDNTAPTFTEPDDITIYKDENCNHDASPGATGDVTDEDDNCDPTLDATFSDVAVPGTCIGELIITRTWSLTDDCGNITQKDQVIMVEDTTAPTFSGVSANPSVLWPPNHKMVLVTINYLAADNCSPASAITSSLAVVSDEPINGLGDGDTDPDWEVVDNHQVWLRAERAGNGDGRVYTITITATDDCGNTSNTTVQVFVPHDQNSLIVRGNGQNTDLSAYAGDPLTVRIMPNPSNSYFNVHVFSVNKKETVNLYVHDISGRMVEKRTIQPNTMTRIGETYGAGVYIIKVTQAGKNKEIKLVKSE